MTAMQCPCCGVGEIEPPRHFYTGERIAWLRHLRGLSQAQLAELVGLSRPQISNIEAGRYDPKIRQLPTYAKALNVRPSDLVV